MTEAEKREQIQAIAQAEFDATNQAAMQALASRSNSIKRQSSSAKIDQEANTKKKAATNGGQSASNSLSVNSDIALD